MVCIILMLCFITFCVFIFTKAMIHAAKLHCHISFSKHLYPDKTLTNFIFFALQALFRGKKPFYAPQRAVFSHTEGMIAQERPQASRSPYIQPWAGRSVYIV